MTKENIEKITKNRSPLDISDISAEEKKVLMALLEKKGFTTTTFYLRFFQKGFDAWEILGVNICKKKFLELPDTAKALLEFEEDGETESKGYLYTLAMSDEPGIFYECLRKVGLCVQFLNFMLDYGMSQTTTSKRFRQDEFKQWEREGIQNILEDYLNE